MWGRRGGQSGQQTIQSPLLILLNNPGSVHGGPTGQILQAESSRKASILSPPTSRLIDIFLQAL